MMTRNIILVVLLVLGMQSCKKETGAPANQAPSSFSEVFDQFWNSMNNRYVFWKEDSTDWDAMYTKYKTVFDKMDITKLEDLKKSVSLFRDMTAKITDGHYYIEFTQPALKDSFVNPSQERKLKSPYYHNPVNYSRLVRPKLDAGFQAGSYDRTSVMLGTINKNILYFSSNAFYLYDAYTATADNQVKTILESFFQELAKSPSPYKALIIDLRGNRGGDISDLNFIAGRLTATPVSFGFTRYKSNAGRYDYTPWISSKVTPVNGSKGVSIPIIALADNFSGSLAESVTMAIQEMPNGTFIGEPTWGANGPYATNELLYNAGPFELKGFMKVQTSSAAFKNAQGVFTESKGIIPDLFVPFDAQALQLGRDLIMEAALQPYR